MRIPAALLILSLPMLALSQRPEPDVRSRIDGMIVKASDGDPLAGVTLLLKKEGTGSSEKQYGTTTASDGHFTLRDIPQGKYILSASKPGFVTQQYGQRQPNRPGAVLDLTRAQTLRDVTIRMSAGGVISGRVVDQTGEPIEGTIIRAFTRRYQRDGKPLLSEAGAVVTNDLGEYRMYWLAPGTYYLGAVVLPTNRANPNPNLEPIVIDQSEQRPDAFAPVFYPNGDDDSQARPIRIEAGSDMRAIDFSLIRTKALRVKGRVVSAASGQPVADAVLEMRLNHVGPVRVFGLAAHTDGQGNFEFRNASPGSYILSTRWTEPGFRSMFTQQDIHIGNKDVADLQLVLQPNSISGRVIMERGEAPPLNRTVLLFNQDDGTSFGTGLQPDGSFEMSNLSTGVLRPELTGFPDNFFIRSARAGNKDVLREGLDLGENLVDTLEVIVASSGASVEGVVQDERQATVVGAHVVLMPNADRRDRKDLVKTAMSDQFGRFAIRGVVPGDYKIFVWEDLEPNIYFDPSFIQQYESQGKPVHLDEDGYITATLRPLALR